VVICRRRQQPSRTNETIKTYRIHLAKLRWCCEQELGRSPSTWRAQDVKAFKMFLLKLPEQALCAAGAKEREEGYTPFHNVPAASSQACWSRRKIDPCHFGGAVRT
jgi:hypothetical protein